MIYTDAFFKRRRAVYHSRELELASILYHCLHPESVIDVGCAIGSLMEGFSRYDVAVVGLEMYAEKARKYATPEIAPLIHEYDAGGLVAHNRVADLVTSIEVAEHLPEEKAANFARNLFALKADGGRIVMTAAGPGQRGRGHLNCQSAAYWVDLMESAGATVDVAALDAIRQALADAGDKLHLAKNLMVFA